MADNEVKKEEGIYAPNVKNDWLAEVEEDAIRIQTKRFKDAEEERQVNVAKREAADAKLNKKGN